VIIAEFVIGDYAFGTAANLNLASRTVRQETLPVLYETVCLDVIDSQEPPKSVEYSPGFRYTKYVRDTSMLNDDLTSSIHR
jgi:hypothetical protein